MHSLMFLLAGVYTLKRKLPILHSLIGQFFIFHTRVASYTNQYGIWYVTAGLSTWKLHLF